MKKLVILFTATAAFSLLPSVSQAVCVATGEISRSYSPPTAIGKRGTGKPARRFAMTVSK